MAAPATHVEGWLEKSSAGKQGGLSWGGFRSKWDRRFFVLRGSTLMYYKDESADASAGTIDCSDAAVEWAADGLNFSISTDDRTLALRASNTVDVERWRVAFSRGGARGGGGGGGGGGVGAIV